MLKGGPQSAKGIQGGPRGTQGGLKESPRGAKGGPVGVQRDPGGGLRDPSGTRAFVNVFPRVFVFLRGSRFSYIFLGTRILTQIYLYTSVDPYMYMHGVLEARVLGFGVLWDSSFILLPCTSSRFLEYSRVVSINLEGQEEPGRSSGGPSPHNIHSTEHQGREPQGFEF